MADKSQKLLGAIYSLYSYYTKPGAHAYGMAAGALSFSYCILCSCCGILGDSKNDKAVVYDEKQVWMIVFLAKFATYMNEWHE